MERSVFSGNPAIVRREIQTAYERYALGIDLFPKVVIRNLESEEQLAQLPRKTRPAVKALAKAWDRIDEDESWWKETLLILGDRVGERVSAGNFDNPMCSIVRVGRNVVRLGIVRPPEGPEEQGPVLMISEDRASKFVGGGAVTIEGGKVTGDVGPALAVVRGSNASLVYGSEGLEDLVEA
jgi:hypothetical protein